MIHARGDDLSESKWTISRYRTIENHPAIISGCWPNRFPWDAGAAILGALLVAASHKLRAAYHAPGCIPPARIEIP
jgi:hypothetical protein